MSKIKNILKSLFNGFKFAISAIFTSIIFILAIGHPFIISFCFLFKYLSNFILFGLFVVIWFFVNMSLLIECYEKKFKDLPEINYQPRGFLGINQRNRNRKNK